MENFKRILYTKASKSEILLHSGIFFLFILVFWSLWARDSIKDFWSFAQIFLYSMTYGVVLLFNIYYLFNKFFINKKYVLYALLSILTFQIGNIAQRIIFSMDINELFDLYISGDSSLYFDIVINIFTFIMLGSFGLLLLFIQRWNIMQRHISEMEKLNLEMELENLKNQISPHFLFNTLNNIYVLSKTKSEITSDSIMHLSDIIRYQLNASKKEYVDINDEVEYLWSLLNLEKIRKDALNITFEKEISDEHILIHPLIFSPLVENTIKHGSQKAQTCDIHIHLLANSTQINFNISNSMSSNENVDMNGSGIKNLKRRLDICYKDKHLLEFKVFKMTFIANLKIYLQ
jgi:two-component system, LytTR family, sensor kinase